MEITHIHPVVMETMQQIIDMARVGFDRLITQKIPVLMQKKRPGTSHWHSAILGPGGTKKSSWSCVKVI